MVLVVNFGVIDKLSPVISVNEVDDVENVSDFDALTTCNTLPVGIAFDVTNVPVVVGSVNVVLPETAGACSMIDPLVSPDMLTELIAPPIYCLTARLY